MRVVLCLAFLKTISGILLWRNVAELLRFRKFLALKFQSFGTNVKD